MTLTRIAIIILVTIVYAFGFNETLFRNLNYFGFKYKKQTKWKSLWLIFYMLLSLTVYFYLVQLLLFR